MSDANGESGYSTDDFIRAWRLLTLACRYVSVTHGIPAEAFQQAVERTLPRIANNPDVPASNEDHLRGSLRLAQALWRDLDRS